MKNVIRDGLTFPFSQGTAVTSGSIVVRGDQVGVAMADYEANQPGTARSEGVFLFDKQSVDVFNVGEAVYFDGTNLTPTKGTNKYVGVADESRGAGTLTVQVHVGATPPLGAL